MKTKTQQRNFMHTCTKCEFLGEHEHTDGTFIDMYLHEFSIIFRYGNREDEQRNIPLDMAWEYAQAHDVYEVGLNRALFYIKSRN